MPGQPVLFRGLAVRRLQKTDCEPIERKIFSQRPRALFLPKYDLATSSPSALWFARLLPNCLQQKFPCPPRKRASSSSRARHDCTSTIDSDYKFHVYPQPRIVFPPKRTLFADEKTNESSLASKQQNEVEKKDDAENKILRSKESLLCCHYCYDPRNHKPSHMPDTSDSDVFHLSDKGENEKLLGGSIVDRVFGNRTKKTSIHLQLVFGDKWGSRGDPTNPDVIKIEVSDQQEEDGPCETGLELRRFARGYRKPAQLVHRNLASKEETLLAAIETVPIQDVSSKTTNTTIYSPEPSFKGQLPTSGASASNNNGITSTMYPRATIKKHKSKGASFEYVTTIEMIEQRSAEGSMQRSVSEASLPSTIFTSEEVPGPTGPQTIIRKKEGESPSKNIAASIVCSSLAFSKQRTVTITIAPGIDPCLIICLTCDMMNRIVVSDPSKEEVCLELCCSAICGC